MPKREITLIIIICLRSRKTRELLKLPKNYINKKKLMAEMNSKKVRKSGKRRSFFFYVGKLLKGTVHENLKVFFPSINLGFGR